MPRSQGTPEEPRQSKDSKRAAHARSPGLTAPLRYAKHKPRAREERTSPRRAFIYDLPKKLNEQPPSCRGSPSRSTTHPPTHPKAKPGFSAPGTAHRGQPRGSRQGGGAPRPAPPRDAAGGTPRPPARSPPRQAEAQAGVGELSVCCQLPPQRNNGGGRPTHAYSETSARCPRPGRLRPRTYPLSASCPPPPPCPRLLARLARLSLALTPSACPAAAAPAWDAHSTATPRANPSSRPRHIASPESPGCERPPPPLRRRSPPAPAALSPTGLSQASCRGREGEGRGISERGKAGAAAPRPPPPAPAPRRRRPPASPALALPREAAAAAAGDGERLPGAAPTLPSLQQHPRGLPLPLPHPPRTARGRHRRSQSRSGAASVSRA